MRVWLLWQTSYGGKCTPPPWNSTSWWCLSYSVFLPDCLTRVRPPTKAVRIHRLWSPHYLHRCLTHTSDSLFCSSITCQWQSNTGGCDSGKGSSVNLNPSEGLISEVPKCTVEQDNVLVIGPVIFQQCEKIETPSVSLMLSSQGHNVEGWMWCICFHALRPITAYPAAAVQSWGGNVCALHRRLSALRD